MKHADFLYAIGPKVHIHHTIHDRKDFLPIIDVPPVRLIGPMQFDGGAVQVCNWQTAPGPVCSKFFASNRFHHVSLSTNEMKPNQGAPSTRLGWLGRFA
jgi:hypothetical protein